MSNPHAIDKFDGNAHCCHLLFNCAPPIVCPHFSANVNGFLQAVWKFEAKLMSTTPVSVFDGIYHVIAAFESNLIPPGEGWFFWYLVSSIVLSYIEWIRLLHIFEL